VRKGNGDALPVDLGVRRPRHTAHNYLGVLTVFTADASQSECRVGVGGRRKPFVTVELIAVVGLFHSQGLSAASWKHSVKELSAKNVNSMKIFEPVSCRPPSMEPAANRTRADAFHASGGCKNFEGKGRRQFISPVVIYRKCTRRTVCLLHRKRRLFEKF